MRKAFVFIMCLSFTLCSQAFDENKFLDAIEKVESGGRNIRGKHGEVGPYQIRQCVIDDLNKSHKKNMYTLKDAENRILARKICMEYVLYWTRKRGIPANYENCARIWNGGPNGFRKQSTINYWKKVRRELNEY